MFFKAPRFKQSISGYDWSRWISLQSV
jgi:hypothetical protein